MEKYILFASPRSPFARRIRIALKKLDIPHDVEFMNVFQKNEKLLKANPLGLVPTLITPEVGVLSDSAAILEFLEDKTGAIWPSDFVERAHIRQASTWCSGLMQYAVSYFIETAEHAVPDTSWAKEYEENAAATLERLAQLPASVWSQEGALTQAAWDLGTAIQYVQLRLPQLKVEEKFPALIAVLSECLKHQFFSESVPPPM